MILYHIKKSGKWKVLSLKYNYFVPLIRIIKKYLLPTQPLIETMRIGAI